MTVRPTRGLMRLAAVLLLVGVWAADAEARITQLVLTRVESPTFGGREFGPVGPFEKLVGVAYGEVDPGHPLNAIIQDLELAPRNARGMVEYWTEVYIIKPVDMPRGNRMLFYNVVNRGNKGGFTTFNVGATQPANEPTDPGDGFLQHLGYTLIWSGWQPDVRAGGGRLTMSPVVARNPDGSPITGLVRQEIIVGSPTFSTGINTSRFTSPANHTTYATASLDNRTPFADGFLPTLTVRTNPEDLRVAIPNDQWTFGRCPDGVSVVPSAVDICLTGGQRFEPGRLYELIYRARDPIVMGLGYAAMRDLIAFFKHERRDDAGNPNPLWLEGERPLAVFMGSSQSGRNMRTFLHLGFNEDEAGRIVFEGAFPHIGGGRAQFNSRFSHAGRAWGHVPDADYPAYEFPFSYMPTHDPLTGQTNAILKRCLKTHTCPKIFHVATALEMWEGRQSLGLTDPLGRHDLGEPGFIRTYIMGSTQHGSATPIPGSRGGPFGDCAQQTNPNPQREAMRALWKAFTDWVRDGVPPPPSVVPRLRDGTLVPASQVRFPSIPANTYEGISRPAVRFLGVANPLPVRHYGPLFDNADESGIITVEPPQVVSTRGYTILVPQVDADGNDLAGRMSTTVLAPLGTYTGWNLGRPGRWPDHLCSLQGSFIPFARTRAERLAVGDPRPSLEERYGSHEGYVAAVRRAAEQLVQRRLLLPEDAQRLIAEAEASDVLR
ncbi:MAG TPA: alpha/beta hydrolase domain-containing protein [Candidatus Binatia bacterium]|nr:alpha/beta hydrolase domain-containing protein [Candidatus Binatia bacterium]